MNMNNNNINKFVKKNRDFILNIISKFEHCNIIRYTYFIQNKIHDSIL